MQTFTAFEYLLMDAAEAFGMDKAAFDYRIGWAERCLRSGKWPEDRKAKKPMLYRKALMAIEQARRGEAVHHMVGKDSCSSGPQILAAVTGCEVTARHTGLIDPNRCPDLYSDVCDGMRGKTGLEFSRSETKTPTMTFFYCSKAEPKKTFGEDTPELEAFYECLFEVAPGACVAMDMMESAWQPWALEHSWIMPDGFTVKLPVYQYADKKIEVDELNHATFTHRVWENRGMEHYISLPANITHSLDAFVVRELVRRCSYNREQLLRAQDRIMQHFMGRDDKNCTPAYFVSLRMATHSDDAALAELSTGELCCLLGLIHNLLKRPSFPVLTIHDDFKCHPNYMNWVRQTYIDILAELADSDVFTDILSQITGKRARFNKLSTGLGNKIRQSNYPLA